MSASEHKKGRNDVQARLYNANPTQVASVCYRLAVFFHGAWEGLCQVVST